MSQVAPAMEGEGGFPAVGEVGATGMRLPELMAGTPWMRILFGWALAYVTGLACAGAVYAAGWWGGGGWEVDTLTAVHATETPWMDTLMLYLPLVGTNYTLAPMIAIAVVLLYRSGWGSVALHLAVVQLGSWTLNPALKFSVPRARPELFEQRGQHAFPAFPSGHAIAVVAVLFTVAWLIHRSGRGTWGYWLVGIFFLINSYSRVYLQVHWPTDVLAGVAVGGVWLVWTLSIFAPLHRRRPASATNG